jgi:hypothetical protein
MPYRYGFVRAVLPLYLRVPTADEQLKSEFKLQEHLDWYKENEADGHKPVLGAWDVPLDARGVPMPGKKLGELGRRQELAEMASACCSAARRRRSHPRLARGRQAHGHPNISDFKVPEYAVFADRARRTPGLAFIGSFARAPTPSTAASASPPICASRPPPR